MTSRHVNVEWVPDGNEGDDWDRALQLGGDLRAHNAKHVYESEKPARTYPSGRVCIAPNCSTILSVYNSEERCWEHTDTLTDSLGNMRHGIRSTYENWGCRCQPCTEANTERSRKQRYFKNHNLSSYKKGCRCATCSAAGAEDYRAKRKGSK